jgi:GNAT superfamily N-acetyltransferase
MVNIRKLAEDDLAALALLYKQFWGEESSLQKMRSVFQRLSRNPGYIFLVAETEHRVVGSVMGIVCEELYGECKPFMVVEDMIVDQHHRRLGIATLLMEQLEKHACDNRCAYIIFVTESNRADAHQFYQSAGYTVDAYKGFKKRLENNRGR